MKLLNQTITYNRKNELRERNMNFQKYSTTNISSVVGSTGAGAPSSTSHLSNLNSSLGYMSNSSMKRQSSTGGGAGNTRQEQSVERLKSCIADLKKLASNKIKR
jgi:hypothetical protein